MNPVDSIAPESGEPFDISFYAEAFQESQVSCLIVGADGRVLFWNSAAEQMFGWTESEVLGKSLPFVPAERREEHQQLRRRGLEGEGFTGRHITRLRKDGSLIELSLSTALIRDGGGQVAGIIAVYEDITEERRAEELIRLRQSLANEQLDELERYYATAPIGLGFLDTDLRYVRVNERLAQINGLSVAEHIGEPLEEITPELAEAITPVCREVLASGIAVIEQEVESSTPALPGVLRDWLVSFHPLKQPDGTVLGISMVISDVTERKRLTDQLKRQDAQLRLVIDAVPGLVGYVDRDYRYQFTNRGYAQWFHRPPFDFEGRTAEEVLGPQFTEVRELLDRAMQGETLMFERRHEYPDRIRDVQVNYVGDLDSDGEPRGVVVLVQDVTERKRAEQALRDSEERFRRIVEIASEGIWMVDDHSGTTFVNHKMSDLLGYTPEEMMGRQLYDFLDPMEVDRARRCFERRKQGDQSPYEYRFRRKEGTTVWLDITATVMRDENGAVTGVLGMLTDITERKIHEHQLRQTQKLESLGILAGGIAHDFNNLLVAIMGNVSLALDAMELSGPPVAMLRDAIFGCERAAQLTRQLLAYAGKDRGTWEVLDAGILAKDLTRLLTTSIPKLVRLSVEAEDVPPIRADSAQLQQVLMNLVINAAESIPDRAPGRVKVTVTSRQLTAEDQRDAVIPIEHAADEYVAISVSDTGCGMDEATQARVFDPFFTTKFDGRGLGLSAVLGIVKAHRGTLTLQSAPGAGTSFTILLPASSAPLQASVPAPARHTSRRHTGTILVVDDETPVRTMAQRALEFYGYRVLAAENGQAAVDMLAEHPEITAVVLDLAMPVMSGDTAAPLLRAQRPDIPLILSSGYSESEASERFGNDVLSGFLQKPYTATKLVSKVSEMIDARSGE